MAFENLKDVYIDQLQDLYSANRQALSATAKMAEQAQNNELKAALDRGVKGINDGLEVLGTLIKGHGAEPTGEFCKGMEGIVKEAHAHALEAEFTDNDVRDAVIITQYQRMTHYALAGYGCVVAFARRLDLGDEVQKLQTCLDNTYHGDSEMTRIAVGEVNKQAV